MIMYPVEQCVLFQRTEEDVQAVRQVFGLTENSIREGVDSIMEWFQKQPHLAHIEINGTIVELMIIIAKGSIERAKEKIDNFYKYRFLFPELIQNRKQILCSSNKVWELYTVIAMPKLQDNRRVFILKVGTETENSKIDIEEFYRRIFMFLDLKMICDYMAGDIWIIDVENVKWKQILTLNPLVIKKATQLFVKALNWRIYGIHVINPKANSHIVQWIIDFLKQFITSVIMDRVIVHENLQDLYKYVPKECLPEDYGGDELSSGKLIDITEKFFKNPKITEYLLECSKMVSNESLRPRDENSEEFLSGSFRQLEVD